MREKKLIVDPGFVHHRKIEAILEEVGTEIISNQIAKIPVSTPEWRKEILIDNIYSRIILDLCGAIKVKTLQQVLFEECGRLFCSIVKLKPCNDLYDVERAILRCEEIEGSKYQVEFHITTDRVRSDTLRTGLHKGGEFAIVGQFIAREEKTIIFHPLLIGYPYMSDAASGELLWEKYTDFYRVYLEDFEEFQKVKNYPLPESVDDMRLIKEEAFKQCLGKILVESPLKDWGGESSDFITSHLHIDGQRLSAAFLLKGPAKFSPMTINHLGKNGDQIIRLSKEPVDILIVQHCHDISPPVIETLKVFATQPTNPRRFCVIDGRESLRMLKAFSLFDWAVEQSNERAKV